MRGLLHRGERKQANVVGLAHFLERPAHAHVARQSPAAIGRAFEGGDGDGHPEFRSLEASRSNALVSVPRLVAAVLVLVRSRQVAEDLVRVPGVERGRARRALLDRDPVLGERLPRPRHDDAVPDPHRVHRPAHFRRGSPVAELRLDPARPGRLVVRELDLAPVTGGARLLSASSYSRR